MAFAESQVAVVENLAAGLEALFAVQLPAALQPVANELRKMLLD